MSGKKNKLKRKLDKVKNRLNNDQDKFLEKLKKTGRQVVVNPKGEVRMSDVLQDFAEPLLMETSTDDEVKMAIRFAILVWNASLMPKPEKEKELKALITQLSKSDNPSQTTTMKFYVDMLLKRKEEMFPDIKRAIIDCHFFGSGSKLRFDVASTV